MCVILLNALNFPLERREVGKFSAHIRCRAPPLTFAPNISSSIFQQYHLSYFLQTRLYFNNSTSHISYKHDCRSFHNFLLYFIKSSSQISWVCNWHFPKKNQQQLLSFFLSVHLAFSKKCTISTTTPLELSYLHLAFPKKCTILTTTPLIFQVYTIGFIYSLATLFSKPMFVTGTTDGIRRENNVSVVMKRNFPHDRILHIRNLKKICNVEKFCCVG